MKSPFLLRMTKPLRTSLEEEAKELGITLTALILQILGQHTKKEQQKQKSQKRGREV